MQSSSWYQHCPRAKAGVMVPSFQMGTARLREARQGAWPSAHCGWATADRWLAGCGYGTERGFCDKVAFSASGGVCREGCLSPQVNKGPLASFWPVCYHVAQACSHAPLLHAALSLSHWCGTSTTLALGYNAHTLARRGDLCHDPRKQGRYWVRDPSLK